MLPLSNWSTSKNPGGAKILPNGCGPCWQAVFACQTHRLFNIHSYRYGEICSFCISKKKKIINRTLQTCAKEAARAAGWGELSETSAEGSHLMGPGLFVFSSTLQRVTWAQILVAAVFKPLNIQEWLWLSRGRSTSCQACHLGLTRDFKVSLIQALSDICHRWLVHGVIRTAACLQETLCHRRGIGMGLHYDMNSSTL